MIVLKELFLSLVLGGAAAGILTAVLLNNPNTWYKIAKRIKKMK